MCRILPGVAVTIAYVQWNWNDTLELTYKQPTSRVRYALYR